MSHEENKQNAGTLNESLEEFAELAIQFAEVVQEAQEGILAGLAEELPGSQPLESVVDNLGSVKARAQEIHSLIEAARNSMLEVVYALNQAG